MPGTKLPGVAALPARTAWENWTKRIPIRSALTGIIAQTSRVKNRPSKKERMAFIACWGTRTRTLKTSRETARRPWKRHTARKSGQTEPHSPAEVGSTRLRAANSQMFQNAMRGNAGRDVSPTVASCAESLRDLYASGALTRSPLRTIPATQTRPNWTARRSVLISNLSFRSTEVGDSKITQVCLVRLPEASGLIQSTNLSRFPPPAIQSAPRLLESSSLIFLL